MTAGGAEMQPNQSRKIKAALISECGFYLWIMPATI
jgi:hypothetical protein